MIARSYQLACDVAPRFEPHETVRQNAAAFRLMVLSAALQSRNDEQTPADRNQVLE